MMTSETLKHSAFTAEEDERADIEYDLVEQENRSDTGEDEILAEAELDVLKRDLNGELNELEWEFKQTKDMLYNERLLQVECKLAQARAGTAPEFLNVVSLVEETYKIRHQVAKSRMQFATKVATQEFENERQVAECIAAEKLQTSEEAIRRRLQESYCRLQVERALETMSLSRDANLLDPTPTDLNAASGFNSRTILATVDNNFHLPGPDLEPRKKAVTLPPTAPRLVYQLSEDDIREDVEAIMAAVKEHKMSVAMSEMNDGKFFF